MTFGSLFSGIGGMDLGLERAGMECRWQVEWSIFNQRILAKHWPAVPRYGDISGVDGTQLEPVDLVCGGFPCEDISLASGTSVGIIGSRSGLWSEFARILREVQPRFAFIENVPALRGRGLALVLQDLWALGFDAEWHCIPASALGANHERDRIFIVSYPAGLFREAIIWAEPNRDERSDLCTRKDADINRLRQLQPEGSECEFRRWTCDSAGQVDVDAYCEPLVRAAIARGERHAWTVEPGVVRMVHGIPNRVDRVASLGRVVVPQVAEWIGRRILEVRVGT